MNQVNLIGRLGADPEIRAMPSGENVANVRLATTERWRNKDGEAQERTEWHRISVFGKVADVIGEWCHKGQEMAFTNLQIRTRKWQDKDGSDRYSTELVFGPKSAFEFLRPPAGDTATRERAAPREKNPQQELPGTNTGGSSRPNIPNAADKEASESRRSADYLDDDIPF